MTTILAQVGALSAALSAVMPAVSRRAQPAIYSHVTVTARPGAVSLTSNGGDNVSMCAPIEGATSDAPASFTIAARELAAILKGAPSGGAITIAPGHGVATVRVGATSAAIASLSGGDVAEPVLTDFEPVASMSLPGDVLARALEVTAHAMSSEETRYYLNGVFMHPASEYDGGGVRFVATDGHRLVRHTVAMEAPTGDWGIIIPTAAVRAILKLLSRAPKAERSALVNVDISGTGIRLASAGVIVDARGVDGTFPDYGRCIPTSNPLAVTFDRRNLVGAIKAVSAVWDRHRAAVCVELGAGTAMLGSVADGARASASVACDLSGDPVQIGFNGRYLLDMLGAMKGTSVKAHLADPGAPAVWSEDDATLHVLMPMRVDHFSPIAPTAPAGEQPPPAAEAVATPTGETSPPTEEIGAYDEGATGDGARADLAPRAEMQGDVLEISAGGFRTTIAVREISRHWDALSHVPDRRARFEMEALAQRLTAFFAYAEWLRAAAGLDAAWQVEHAQRFAIKHVGLTRAAWAADGRCMSSFIVGPANFPVARNAKRQAAADNAQREIRAHLDNAREAVRRRAFPHGAPGEAIRADNPDAPVLIRDEIREKRAEHADALAINAAARRLPKGLGPEEAAHRLADETGVSAALAERAARLIGLGYGQPMNPARSLAEIKRLEDRLAAIERNRAAGAPEVTWRLPSGGTVRVVEDGAAARIRLYFDGKPDEAARAELKGRAFRWSPSEGAWQRHLNNAGRWAAEAALTKLGAVKEGPPPSGAIPPEAAPPSEEIPRDLDGPLAALGPITVDVGGRIYRATAAFDGPDAVAQANAYLADHPGEAVIAERDGSVWCARCYDLGTPTEATPIVYDQDTFVRAHPWVDPTFGYPDDRLRPGVHRLDRVHHIAVRTGAAHKSMPFMEPVHSQHLDHIEGQNWEIFGAALEDASHYWGMWVLGLGAFNVMVPKEFARELLPHEREAWSRQGLQVVGSHTGKVSYSIPSGVAASTRWVPPPRCPDTPDMFASQGTGEC